jgi:hypothetical protein
MPAPLGKFFPEGQSWLTQRWDISKKFLPEWQFWLRRERDIPKRRPAAIPAKLALGCVFCSAMAAVWHGCKPFQDCFHPGQSTPGGSIIAGMRSGKIGWNAAGLFQSFQVSQVLVTVGGFLVLFETLEINEIDRNAFHFNGDPGRKTVGKFHTWQSGKKVNASRGIAQLNDLVGYHEIGFIKNQFRIDGLP